MEEPSVVGTYEPTDGELQMSVEAVLHANPNLDLVQIRAVLMMQNRSWKVTDRQVSEVFDKVKKLFLAMNSMKAYESSKAANSHNFPYYQTAARLMQEQVAAAMAMALPTTNHYHLAALLAAAQQQHEQQAYSIPVLPGISVEGAGVQQQRHFEQHQPHCGLLNETISNRNLALHLQSSKNNHAVGRNASNGALYDNLLYGNVNNNSQQGAVPTGDFSMSNKPPSSPNLKLGQASDARQPPTTIPRLQQDQDSSRKHYSNGSVSTVSSFKSFVRRNSSTRSEDIDDSEHAADKSINSSCSDVNSKERKRAANRLSAQLSRTRKKQLAEKLSRENDELRRKEQILMNLPDLVVVFDSAGLLYFVSQTINQFINFSAAELEGKSIWERLCSESVQLVKSSFMDAMAAETTSESDTVPLGNGSWNLRLVDKDGGLVPVSVNGAVRFGGERPECVCCFRHADPIAFRNFDS